MSGTVSTKNTRNEMSLASLMLILTQTYLKISEKLTNCEETMY